MLQKLFERNIAHFGQAEGTPFTIDPLLEEFGYTGMTSQGSALVQDGIISDSLRSIPPHASFILQCFFYLTKTN